MAVLTVIEAQFKKVYVEAPEGVDSEQNYYYTLVSSSISESDLDLD